MLGLHFFNRSTSSSINRGNAPSIAQQIVEIEDILFATNRPYLKNIAIVTNLQNNQLLLQGLRSKNVYCES